jgi:hypothetical protein
MHILSQFEIFRQDLSHLQCVVCIALEESQYCLQRKTRMSGSLTVKYYKEEELAKRDKFPIDKRLTMLASGRPLNMYPPSIWQMGWILNWKPVIPICAPKNRTHMKVSIVDIKKPHPSDGQHQWNPTIQQDSLTG